MFVLQMLTRLAETTSAKTGGVPFATGFRSGFKSGLKYGNGPAGYAAGMQLADAKQKEMKYMALAALYAKAHNYRD